jgi:hypothetical protein
MKREAAEFLHTHLSHIQSEQADPKFDETQLETFSYWEQKGTPRACMLIGQLHRALAYKDIIDPICDFILTEHERTHQTEPPQRELVPIRVCKRPGCGKFIMSERKDLRKFCDDSCRALNQGQSKSLEEKSSYMMLWRLKGKSIGTLRQELEKPQMKQRLAEIEARFLKLAPKVNALRARAEKPKATKAI